MQETLKRPPSADAAEVIVQRSDKAGDSGVCGCARRHLRLWLGAAAFAALALVIGLAVGLTMGKCGRWCQPSTPRRAFSYKHFESCKHVQEAFKSEVLAVPTDVSLTRVLAPAIIWEIAALTSFELPCLGRLVSWVP